MKTTIKLGFIGVGFVAQQCHLPCFESIDDCEIYAISDLHDDLAKNIALKYNATKIYNSHIELLRDPLVDAVVITVPRPLTYGLCKLALQAGKYVFTEKPLALNSSSAKDILTMSKELNVPIYIGYMRRMDASVSYLKQLISHELLNHQNPILLNASCYMGDSYCRPFGDFKSTNTTKLSSSSHDSFPDVVSKSLWHAYETYLNVYSHMLDLLDYLFDSNLEIHSICLDSKSQGVSIFLNQYKFPIVFSTAKQKISEWNERIEIIYRDKKIELKLPAAFLRNQPGILNIQEGFSITSTTIVRPEWSWSFKNQAEHFIDICHKWPDHETNLTSAVRQITLIEKMFSTAYMQVND